MQIEVTRTGGIAGMTRRARVDTDALHDESAAAEWRVLADQAREMLISHIDEPTPHGRDAFVWTVSVGDTTCEMKDSSVTGPLRDLAQRTLREGSRP